MDAFDRFVSFIKTTQIKRGSLITGAANVAANTARAVSNPLIDAVSDIAPQMGDESGAYSLGSVIGALIQKPFANTRATARKSRKMKDTDLLLEYINKTDESEMLLREARKLRRKARIIKQKRKEEELLKKHVENSRYF